MTGTWPGQRALPSAQGTRRVVQIEDYLREWRMGVGDLITERESR